MSEISKFSRLMSPSGDSSYPSNRTGKQCFEQGQGVVFYAVTRTTPLSIFATTFYLTGKMTELSLSFATRK